MPPVSGISPLAVSLPKGGGDVRGLGGSFVATYNRGTGSYTIDLRLPTGPADFGPSLALTYSSGAPNGVFGLGWSLNVPAIHRNAERRFVTYDDGDGFVLDQHGELAPMGGGQYRPVRDELFARIVRGEGWEVRLREGVVQRFGTDAGSRMSDPDDPARVLAWALRQTADRNGNTVEYRYLRDGNNLFLQEIVWSIYRVVLAYERRPDVYGTSRHGFPVETRLRCTAIEAHCDRLPGATLIRRYGLSYVSPPETPLSLLHQIVLAGRRVDGGVVREDAMPPLTLNYTPFRAEASRCRPLTPPAGFPLQPLGLDGGDLLDLTGDGLPDIVQIDGTRRRYWANRGDGTWDLPRTIRTLPTSLRIGMPSMSFADMDGDGAVDLLVAGGPRAGYFPRKAGPVWDRFQPYPRVPFSLLDPHLRQVDLDGDGRIDLLHAGASAFTLYLNHAELGWTVLPPVRRVRDPEVFPDVAFDDPRVHLADMTGDGLSDIVQVGSGFVWYWPYEGLGRWGRRRRMLGAPPFPRPDLSRRVFLTDVNGDGLADLIVVDDGEATLWINQFGVRYGEPVRLRHTPLTAGAELRVADMLGTGSAGVLWSRREGGRPASRYSYLRIGGEEKPYLLSGIDNGLGKRTTIRYRTSSHYAARDRIAGRPWNTFLPFPVQVVAEIRQEDAGSGLDTRSEIVYHDGLYDGRERRFVGFGRVDLIEHGDATAPGLITRMRFDQSPAGERSRVDRALAAARWGKPLETIQQTLDGRVLRSTVTDWTALAATAADGMPIVTVQRTRTRSEAPGVEDGPVVVEHAYEYDERGNVTRDRSSANGPVPLVLDTVVSYARWADGELTSLPASVVQRRGDGTLVAEQRTWYDGAPFGGLPLGSAAAGNPTRTSVRVASVAEFEAHYVPEGLTAAGLGYRVEDGAVWTDTARAQYDARGNPAATRDPLGALTQVERDADGLFPVRLRNPAGHETRFEWDAAAQQPRVVGDANGAVSRFGFDGLGRVVRIALPGDTLADPTTSVAYHLGQSPPWAEFEAKTGPGLPRGQRRVFFDGSGSEVQSWTQLDAATVRVSPSRTLDARGWVAALGEPWFAAAMGYGPAPGSETTSCRYDAIGRVVETELPGGRTTRTAYDAFRTLLYDANDTDPSPANVARGFFDTPVIHRFDGWGRLIGVTELHDGLITTHQFRYDHAGRFTEAFGPGGGRIVAQRFDLAGNRIVLEHRDAGRRWFYHDAAGRLVRSVDAAGNRVDTSFDVLGRRTRTLVNGQVVHAFTHDLANPPNQVGRLSAVKDDAGDWRFEYDPRGRVVRRTLTAFGQSWSIEHDFHANGLIAAMRYPDGAEVAYEYNQAGELVGVPGAMSRIDYDARGRRTLVEYANGVRTVIEYDAVTSHLHRLRVLGPADAVLHDVTYHRDGIGNVLEQIDGRPPGPGAPHSRRFTLDGRYRLVQVAGGSPGSAVAPYILGYGYDQRENLLKFPTHGAVPIVYEPAGSNRIAGIETNGLVTRLYEHDANGNVTLLPSRRLTFDALGHLVRAQRSDGAEVEYRYSASGHAVWRIATAAGQTRRTLTLAGIYDQTDSGSGRRFLSADGLPVAIDDAVGRVYLNANELGHIVVMTDAAGGVIDSRHFHPFGELSTLAVPAGRPSFGGRIVDEITGLVHLGARFYAPELGRFVSPDPLYLLSPVHAIGDPRLFNLYAYAANNPMVYADPSGLSLLGSVLGGLVGGIVGALVFIVSGFNPILAGLAGGFAGGAVAGAVDGGVQGAVIGGLLGAAGGLVSGGVMWGAAVVGGGIGGALGEVVAHLPIVLTVGAYGAGYYQLAEHGDWDLLVGMAAGILSGVLAYRVADFHIMQTIRTAKDPGQMYWVRQIAAQAQRKASVPMHLESHRYEWVDTLEGRGGFKPSMDNWRGVTRMSREQLTGKSYRDFREVLFHELGHQHDEAILGQARADAMYKLWRADGAFHDLHPMEIGADRFSQMCMTGAPASWVFIPVTSAASASSLPGSWDMRGSLLPVGEELTD